LGDFECVFVGERDAQAEVRRSSSQFLPQTSLKWSF
jgi:hypothetical protein